jgi:CRP-like cAMP-binding protein
MGQLPTFNNRLLALLPETEMVLLLPHLEAIDLSLKFVITPSGEKIPHVYFIESGLGSIVSVSPLGHKAEAAMFGFEGFAPTPPAVRSDASFHEVVIQSPGTGHRIEVGALWALLDTCPTLGTLMARASHNLATQASYTALSNGTHNINERLTRWLLMSQDRLGGNEITITHGFISLMLAVRRPGVTTALHVLEGEKFIKSTRGLVTILDRPAMLEYARDGYGKPEEEYRLLMDRPGVHVTEEGWPFGGFKNVLTPSSMSSS